MKRFALLALAVGLCATASARAANPVVVMETSMGKIKIELFEDKAPITVKNFLGYVDDKFFDGTTFHRVIPGFMIQGGGFADNKEKPTKAPIRNEAKNGLSNKRGTIAMARTNDPNSATAQFFINHQDNSNLDAGKADPNGYAVFGKVIEGMDVVDRIKDVKTQTAPSRHENVPVKDVWIESMRREETPQGKNPVVVMKVKGAK